MQCQSCGATLGAADRFCQSCGKPVAATCPRCGAKLGPNAAFCASCGVRIGAAPAGAPPPAPSIEQTQPVAYTAPNPPPQYQQTPAPQPPQYQARQSAPPTPPPQYQQTQVSQPPLYQSRQTPPPPPPQYSAAAAGAAVPAAYAAGAGALAGPAPSFRYIGFWRRAFAMLIDGLLLGIASFFITGALGLGAATSTAVGGEVGAGFSVAGPQTFVLLAIDLAYFIILEGLLGTTIGKLILGIKVINAQGKVPGIVPALIRNLFQIIDITPLCIIAIISMALSKKKQRVGDLVAGTYVVAR